MAPASNRNKQLVPDLLAPGLDLVFCGTAPSPASFRARAYYANPGNAFWPTLHAVGLTPERLAPQRYPELLTLGIGLTDLNKTEYGSDHELSAHAMDATALHAKLRRFAEHPRPCRGVEFVPSRIERERVRAIRAAERTTVGELGEQTERLVHHCGTR